MTPAPQPPREPARPSSFPLTKWSLVFNARQGDEEHARRLLGELFTIYWPPLYAYLRRKGHTRDDACDLTQELLLGLLQGDFLEGLDPSRGKFRAFLLASMNNLLATDRARRNRLKRGGGKRFFSLATDAAEKRLAGEPAHDVTPERLFEREWARALLARATARLRQTCEDKGEGGLFGDLWPAVCGQESALSYAELGRKHARSEGAVKVLVHRMRRRFGELLRQEIECTVSAPEEVEEELRSLFGALEGG